MKGSNEFTLSNYLSWIDQDFKTRSLVEYIFSYDEGDSGIEIAKAVSYANMKVVSNPVMEGFTGKMSALTHGLINARNDLVVFSDGDTRAQSDTLTKIMGQFQRGADVVTCLAVYNRTKNLWARLYSSVWNLAEIGIVGPSIIRNGDSYKAKKFFESKELFNYLF